MVEDVIAAHSVAVAWVIEVEVLTEDRIVEVTEVHSVEKEAIEDTFEEVEGRGLYILHGRPRRMPILVWQSSKVERPRSTRVARPLQPLLSHRKHPIRVIMISNQRLDRPNTCIQVGLPRKK